LYITESLFPFHAKFQSYLLFLGSFEKLLKATISRVMSVYASARPHGTVGLQLDGFLLNFIFEHFSKKWRENSSLIKI